MIHVLRGNILFYSYHVIFYHVVFWLLVIPGQNIISLENILKNNFWQSCVSQLELSITLFKSLNLVEYIFNQNGTSGKVFER